MKRLISFILMLTFLLIAVSCGNTPNDATTENNASTAVTTEATTSTEATTVTTEATTTTQEIIKGTEFDEDNIVFSFGAISDVHIANNNDNDEASQKFLSALKQLKEKAAEQDKDGIDAIFTAGDLIDTRQIVQMQQYKKIYESVFDVTEVPNLYCLGHYHDDNWTSAANNPDRNNFITVFGENFYLNEVEPDRVKTGNRHSAVTADDGTVYHVIALEPIAIGPNQDNTAKTGYTIYSNETKTWLDQTLKTITEENPDQYVFILNHAMIYDTVYGSDLGTYWYTEDLTSILSKYPQVVTFSGHLHFPLNDPRSVMQGAFTSFGTGAVRYMAIENGGYQDMAGKTTMNDRYEFSQGLLIQLDVNGNLRATRMDFYNKSTIGDPWIISHPTEDNSHLLKYSRSGRSETNTAPEIKSMTIEQAPAKGGISCTLAFTGVDDEFVHDYTIVLYRNGVQRREFKILADFYKHPKTSDMKAEWKQLLGVLSTNYEYKVTVIAKDSWGLVSEMKEITFTPENIDVPDTPSELPPTPYVDFDFNANGIVDTQGHVTIVSNSGAVQEKSVTHNGTTTKKYALLTKAAAATCIFNELDTREKFTAFAENGFSVEAFFSIPAGSAVQGIVCGTEAGGWGLAIAATGTPYFITGSGVDSGTNTYNTSTYATTVVDKDQLMHVVCVFDYANRMERIYVNGLLESETTLRENYHNGKDAAYNMFCLGADIGPAGTPKDFYSSNMTMVDAKIYNSALTANQVAGAYTTSVSDLSK
ncbi:MAG: hypothetical protein MJ236_01735 [Clostridia bacterium]|nr:hypothetical protein [Clostridia bacterium]